MKTRNRWALLAGLVSVGSMTSAAHPDEPKARLAPIQPVYSVAAYDPKRDAADDLQMTIKQAKAGNKRILMQVGGQWCGWCHLMNKYFHENDKVAAALAKDFIVMEVNYSDENENKDFLGKFPAIKGYPHLFVLESDGTLLHSQGTSELEEGKGYNQKKMLDFLAKWAPKKSK